MKRNNRNAERQAVLALCSLCLACSCFGLLAAAMSSEEQLTDQEKAMVSQGQDPFASGALDQQGPTADQANSAAQVDGSAALLSVVNKVLAAAHVAASLPPPSQPVFGSARERCLLAQTFYSNLASAASYTRLLLVLNSSGLCADMERAFSGEPKPACAEREGEDGALASVSCANFTCAGMAQHKPTPQPK
eukprot:gnl/Hemi2/24142_TR8101_c0_g1_i1.p1 gnl/Hemi2/24142_TR8101_c0_g1~~gnl/Hemi2/24142_TR8101_c0_g1_i1.p1  ORF type:complete len:191 (+),score=56.83 gnl/Hemi2/24142_TR8101_c0_g1_i1:102-674(+)